jgi:hypothetical protein
VGTVPHSSMAACLSGRHSWSPTTGVEPCVGMGAFLSGDGAEVGARPRGQGHMAAWESTPRGDRVPVVKEDA